MRKVRILIKIAVVLAFIAFAGRFVYANIIMPSPFKNELKVCLENSRKLNDPLAVEIAENLCLDVYPHFN